MSLSDAGIPIDIDAMSEAGVAISVHSHPLHEGDQRYHVVFEWSDFRLERRYVDDTAEAYAHLYQDWVAIEAMRSEGYEVSLGITSNQAHRVTVSRRNVGGNVHEPRWWYKQATTSTSGFPIQAAYDKWRAHRQEAGGR